MIEVFLGVDLVFVGWKCCSLVAVAVSGSWASVALGSLVERASVGGWATEWNGDGLGGSGEKGYARELVAGLFCPAG